MRLRVDKQADALYLCLDDSAIVESVEVVPGVVLDYNKAEEVVGNRNARTLRAITGPRPFGSEVRGCLGVVTL